MADNNVSMSILETIGSRPSGGVSGASYMGVYLLGDRLFLHAVAPSEADWLKSREDPELERWSEYMGNYLATDDAGNIIFDTLPEAFAFGMFKSE